MKKYHIKILIVLAFVFLFTCISGCWDSKDINKKLIVTALGFDVRGGEIWFYLEIANTEIGSSKDSAEGASDKFVTYKSSGKTLPEVRDALDEQLDKPLYLSGARTLIFTEDFANEYLVEYLYRFRADETYRKQSLCVITREDPEKLFECAHKNKESVGLYIEGQLDTLVDLGKSYPKTIGRLIENLSSEYSGFLLPCIGIENDIPTVVGYSVVSGPKITGLIPARNGKIYGIIFLKADNAKFDYLVPYKDFIFTVEASLKKREIKPSYKDEAINMDLKFDVSAELLYGDKKTPYDLEDEDLKKMSNILSELIKKDITDAIDEAQNIYGCDYLQFDDTFRIKYPDEFDDMKWEDEFSEIGTSVDVKVDMRVQLGLDYGPNKLS